MNVERVLKLAEYIGSLPPEKLYMADYLVETNEFGLKRLSYTMTMDRLTHECGTAACIAGHALMLFGDADSVRIASRAPWKAHDMARELLGLSVERANYLFYGGWTWKHKHGATPQAAARELMEVASHG